MKPYGLLRRFPGSLNNVGWLKLERESVDVNIGKIVREKSSGKICTIVESDGT